MGAYSRGGFFKGGLFKSLAFSSKVDRKNDLIFSINLPRKSQKGHFNSQ